MNLTEKLEVKIFKDISREKTLIAAVMDPEIVDGVGPMLMRMVPKIKNDINNAIYTGKVRFLESSESDDQRHNPHSNSDDGDTPSYLTTDNHNITFNSDMTVFGGTAYYLHKMKDESPFAHLLPGVHDVDVNFKLRLKGVPYKNEDTHEFPTNHTSTKRLSNHTDALDQPDDILSFILKNIVDSIRTHILEETSSVRGVSRDYDLAINGGINKIRLEAPFAFDEDVEGLVYSEVVANFYHIRIVNDGSMLKTQVEIKASDHKEGIHAIDHAFEIIMIIIKDNEGWVSDFTGEVINGIQVESKRSLFDSNMASLIDRAVSIEKSGEDTVDGRLFAGKCAQDFLRVVYILLDGLQGEKPRWVETKTQTKIYGARVGRGTSDDAVRELGRMGTPIEIFMFISSYIEPCILASRIRDMDVFSNEDGITRTTSMGRDFRTIIDMFKTNFPPGKELLKERQKLERMMLASQEKMRTKIRKMGSNIVKMTKNAEKKGELDYYFSKNFDITMEVSDEEDSEHNIRLTRIHGVLTISGPTYSDGDIIDVLSHGDRNDSFYSLSLPGGSEVLFFKKTFIDEFKRLYPGTPGPSFDENMWYKQWLKSN